MVQRLIQHHALVNLQNQAGDSALMLTKSSLVLDTVLMHNANPNLVNRKRITALILASRRGDDTIVQSLFNGPVQLHVNHQDARGRTALIYAVKGEAYQTSDQHLQIIQRLVQHGAQIHLEDNNGETAWIIARQRRREAVLNILRTVS